MLGSVVRVIDRSVLYFSERVAVREGDRSLTYRELGALGGRLANALVGLGLANQSRVGMLMPNCLEFIPTIYGIWKSGAVFSQMSALAGPKDFEHNLNSIEADALVYHSRFDEQVASLRGNVPSVRTFIRYSGDGSAPPEGVLDYEEVIGRQPDQWAGEPPVPTSIAVAMFTGGTTAAPNAVLIDHENWTEFMVTSPMEVANLEDGVQFVHVAPMSHFSITYIVPTLMRGGTNIVLDGFDAEGFLATVEQFEATASAIVPTIMYTLLDHPATRNTDLSTLKTVIYAGSPVAPERLREALDVFGPILAQYYGGTDFGYTSTLRKSDHVIDGTPEQTKRLGSAGRPLYHVDVSIQDTDDRAVPQGEIGEICVRSGGQMARYCDDEKTATAKRDGWVHSGDLGYLDEAGYLFVVDRKKEMIVSGGMNVVPRQIEDILTGHPAVQEAVVFGVPDPKWGEAVKAVVVLRPGSSATQQQLMDAVREKKGSVYTPKSVELVQAVPRTPVGKVDKKALKEPYWRDYSRNVH